MDTNNNNKVWWVVGIIIIVLIGAWMLMRGKKANAPATAPLVSSIDVDYQDANSIGVNIDSVTFAVPGFVEIHAEKNSDLGEIIGGSKVFQVGTYTDQTIIMTTTPGAYYWAALYGDDGNGIFEAGKDKAILNAAGTYQEMIRFQVLPVGSVKGASKG